MSTFGRKTGGGGAFAYGPYGFLYKKKIGVGGRRSTRDVPGGGAMTNQPGSLFNKYRPGETYVGAQPTAIRRAKNIRAAVCGPDTKCVPVYNRLGVNPYHNIGKPPRYPTNYPIFAGIPVTSQASTQPPIPNAATPPEAIAQL